MSYAGRIRSAFKKPPRIIAFKLVQLLQLWLMAWGGNWQAISLKAQKWVQRHDKSAHEFIVLAGDADQAIHEFMNRTSEDAKRLIALGDDISRRKFEIFGATIKPDRSWPWHEDWRFGKVWPLQPFKKYNFYENRQLPYDIKFPWELSRLNMVVLLLQAAILKPSSQFIGEALDILTDWQEKNPLAHSVNWVPMEASMRAINLVIILELCNFLPHDSREVVIQIRKKILELLICHGKFIWRTREYTDVPGNHYSANLVALLLIGAHFQNIYYPARQWYLLARQSIPLEIERQFTSDGVNFEKSVAYHRLVTELFVIAMVALDRLGDPLAPKFKVRLRQAAYYAASCRRPDGWSVNVGDSDDASALAFEARHPRDHAALIHLCGVYFTDSYLVNVSDLNSLTALWLLGRKANFFSAGQTDHDKAHIRYFRDGGVVVWRCRENYLWIDVGEVGQNGLGGHGHNDLLSFELTLDGQPIIVDPGTYLYTGDLSSRRWFRATAAHNTVTVDHEELAPLLEHWRIANAARPFEVQCSDDDGRILVSASHTGFQRLADPVEHKRIFRIEDNNFQLKIEDVFCCSGRHEIARRLHFPPGAAIELGQRGCTVTVGKVSCKLSWDEGVKAGLEPGWVSEAYGQRQEALVLVLVNWIQGDTKLSMIIDKVRGLV